MNITYQLKDDTVVINDRLIPPTTLNLESAKIAVKTIKANRSTYMTAAAYERHLSKYEGALAFLEVNL